MVVKVTGFIDVPSVIKKKPALKVNKDLSLSKVLLRIREKRKIKVCLCVWIMLTFIYFLIFFLQIEAIVEII